jgi:hypothetical protein
MICVALISVSLNGTGSNDLAGRFDISGSGYDFQDSQVSYFKPGRSSQQRARDPFASPIATPMKDAHSTMIGGVTDGKGLGSPVSPLFSGRSNQPHGPSSANGKHTFGGIDATFTMDPRPSNGSSNPTSTRM